MNFLYVRGFSLIDFFGALVSPIFDDTNIVQSVRKKRILTAKMQIVASALYRTGGRTSKRLMLSLVINVVVLTQMARVARRFFYL
jgi:hypothetical protein